MAMIAKHKPSWGIVWTQLCGTLRQAMRTPQAPAALPPLGTRFSQGYVISIMLCALAVMAWRLTRSYPTGVFDFYPLYYGAKAWLASGNAYNLTPVVPPSHFGYQLFQIGNIYPLPAILLALPFSILPPLAAGTLWLGLVTAGILIALRLNGWPLWLILYVPVIEGVRIEQHTAVVLLLQLLAYWAYRAERPWILALCCTLILSKPNQGFFFVLVLFVLSRYWRQFLIMGAAIWGGSLLLDPNWIAEWIPTLINHHNVLHQSILWPLALFAIPLFLVGNPIGGATVLQFAMLPYPGVYAASAVPISVLDDPRSRWLLPLSFLWIIPAVLIGQAWSTALLLIVPVVILSALRWREQHLVSWAGQPNSPTQMVAGAGK